MATACITCGKAAVPGRSRCRRHGRGGPTHKDPEYGYGWQKRRQKRIDAGEGCAWAWKGGCHGPLHLDHIRPRSLGGPAVEENERLLCERHNIAKGGRNRLKR